MALSRLEMVMTTADPRQIQEPIAPDGDLLGESASSIRVLVVFDGPNTRQLDGGSVIGRVR